MFDGDFRTAKSLQAVGNHNQTSKVLLLLSVPRENVGIGCTLQLKIFHVFFHLIVQ